MNAIKRFVCKYLTRRRIVYITVMRKIKRILVITLVLLLSFSPIIVSFAAGYIANINNCINGQDYGKTLYTMGTAGWLVFFTAPIGIFLLVIFPFILKLISYIKAKYVSA